MTGQLQRIERILGGALFLRDRRGVLPTPLGDLVLARARVLIPAVSGLHDGASELITAGSEARYRVGATNGPIVADLIRRLADAHPGGPVSIQSTWSENEVAQQVLDGRLDYAVVGVCASSTPGQPAGPAWQPISVDAVWVLLNERPPTEIDPSSAFDLVAGGTAVALCQGMVRSVPGTVAVPLRGVPLRWLHLLGWDPDGPAARRAAELYGYAVQAYLEVLGQRPRYARWLGGHPDLGLVAGPDRPGPLDDRLAVRASW